MSRFRISRVKMFAALLVLCVLSPYCLAQVPGVCASSGTAPDIVVVGYINHGPMQPTVNAIKDVTAKYGDKVAVTWIDMSTNQGQAYAQQHGLSAHLTILINGKYQYTVNGKQVAFQWFEGQQWTKADLDAVISATVNGNNNAGSTPTPVKPASSLPAVQPPTKGASATTSNLTSTGQATSTPSTPGFEAVFALAGLLAVAYVVRRMR